MTKLAIVFFFISLFILSCARSRSGPGGINERNYMVIRGDLEGLSDSSWIILKIWDDVINTRAPNSTPFREYKCVLDSGKFLFHIDSIYNLVYISLSYSDGENYDASLGGVNLYLAEPGDSINIKIYNNRVGFYGIGASKYNCRYALDSLALSSMDRKGVQRFRNPIEQMRYYDTSFAVNWLEKTIEDFKYVDLIKDRKLGLLKGYRSMISRPSYETMMLDIESKSLTTKLYIIRTANTHLEQLKPLIRTTHDRKRVLCQQVAVRRLYVGEVTIDSNKDISIKARNISKNYTQFLFQKILLEREYKNNSARGDYYKIKSSYNGIIRDKLLVSYFLYDFDHLPNPNEIISDALTIVKNSECRQVIANIGNRRKGLTGYNFNLPNERGEMVSLEEFRGKIVVLDFWFTGCAGCSKFYKNVLSYVEERYRCNPNVAFVTISIDYNKAMWLKSIQKSLYTTGENENVTNLYTGGAGTECDVIAYYNISSYPHPLLIDDKGVIICNNERLLRDRDSLVTLISNALKKING